VAYFLRGAPIRRAERVGDLHPIDLPRPATAEEIDRGDAPIFRAREAAAWAAKRFPDFPYTEDDWLDSSESTTAPADEQRQPPFDSVKEAAVPVAEIMTPAAHALSVASIVDAYDPNNAEPALLSERRALVDAFIERVWKETHEKIKRKDIWRVASYTEATEFERFQPGKGTSAGSTAKFIGVLQLTPTEFLARLSGLPPEE
jgi:hypothetical protein